MKRSLGAKMGDFIFNLLNISILWFVFNMAR